MPGPNTLAIAAVVVLVILYLVNQSRNLRKDVTNLELYMIDKHRGVKTGEGSRDMDRVDARPHMATYPPPPAPVQPQGPQIPTGLPPKGAGNYENANSNAPPPPSGGFPMFPGFNNGEEEADMDEHAQAVSVSENSIGRVGHPLFGDDE